MTKPTSNMRVEARHLPGKGKQSLYGTHWEICEGTEGLTKFECDLFVKQCEIDDRRENRGGRTTEYVVTSNTPEAVPQEISL